MFSIDTEAGESECSYGNSPVIANGLTVLVLMYSANCILSVLAVLVVIVYSTPGETLGKVHSGFCINASVFAFTLIFITLLYWVIGTLYITTSREIKRFDVGAGLFHYLRPR